MSAPGAEARAPGGSSAGRKSRKAPLAGALALLGLALAAWLLQPPSSRAEAGFQAPARPRVVLVLRHAEKAIAPPGSAPASPAASDPPLSEAGSQRAAALAELLAPARPTALFASEYRRTQDTLAALAEHSGVGVTVIPAGEPARLLAALDALPAGSLAVVAGHSNTVPAIVRSLGGEIAGLGPDAALAALADDDYGRLFAVLRCADGAAATLELALPRAPAR